MDSSFPGYRCRAVTWACFPDSHINGRGSLVILFLLIEKKRSREVLSVIICHRDLTVRRDEKQLGVVTHTC